VLAGGMEGMLCQPGCSETQRRGAIAHCLCDLPIGQLAAVAPGHGVGLLAGNGHVRTTRTHVHV
jgi:hypothetical protein